jgi:ParB family transcriptional regulator, chromosome partitioning protein
LRQNPPERPRLSPVVTIGHDGEPQLICGLLRKEDTTHFINGHDETDGAADSHTPAEPQEYSTVLVETLTDIKTAAIAAELSQQPKVALAGVVYALVLSQLALDLHIYATEGCIQIRGTQLNLMNAADSKAVQALGEQQTTWLQRLPKTPPAIWAWCLEQPVDTLLSLLTFCAALSVNCIQTKADSGKGRLHHANALATALHMDMRNWFTPNADNFFNKVSKSQILEAMTEAAKHQTQMVQRS